MPTLEVLLQGAIRMKPKDGALRAFCEYVAPGALKPFEVDRKAQKVFICYRRDDGAGSAGRVKDRLELEFGPDLLFMDVDAIPLGVNFTKVLREEVAKSDVLLAVIGPNWLKLVDDDGKRRLDDPN